MITGPAGVRTRRERQSSKRASLGKGKLRRRLRLRFHFRCRLCHRIRFNLFNLPLQLQLMTATATAASAEANPTGQLSESPSLLSSSRATSAASSWLHELAVSSSLSLYLSLCAPPSPSLSRCAPSFSQSPPSFGNSLSPCRSSLAGLSCCRAISTGDRLAISLSLEPIKKNNKSITLCVRVCCARVCE